MAQISFKVPEEELKFLKWYSKKSANSISTIYREVTIETYKAWKLDILCELYAKGAIGFKYLCNIGNISFQEGLLLIQEKEIEPPISNAIDDYTNEVTKRMIEDIKSK